MKLTTNEINNTNAVIVSITGDALDASNAKFFKENIQPILSAHQVVLIDMSTLNFLDSSGLGALLTCLRTMNNKEGELKLFAMTKPVQALFELVRMHRIFNIYNSKEEVLASL